jgi:hypothetical protein
MFLARIVSIVAIFTIPRELSLAFVVEIGEEIVNELLIICLRFSLGFFIRLVV